MGTPGPITVKVRDAAAMIGCSTRTVLRLIDDGKLRAVKLTGENGPYFVFVESIHALLGFQEKTRKPSQERLSRKAAAAKARLGF